jgi:hypothetical protein
MDEVFSEAGMSEHQPIIVGDDDTESNHGDAHTLQVDLSDNRKFTLYHVEGGNTIRFEQYRSWLAEGIPRTLELTLQRWLKLTLAGSALLKTLREVTIGDNIDHTVHLGERTMLRLVIKLTCCYKTLYSLILTVIYNVIQIILYTT